LKAPASVLVVDAAILIAAARGRSSGAVLAAAQASVLITTDRAVTETRRRIDLGLKRPELHPIVDALVAEMTVVPVAALFTLLRQAATTLTDAVASRNGSTDDGHLLALAWSADADLWTTDRDFAGTGVASWSTPNLIRGLGSALPD
jgi:predicted nucleic acid-binding protein